MKEMVIFSRHPRFKSWIGSISKRLPLEPSEIRFAVDTDSLENLLSNPNKLLLIDFSWSDKLKSMINQAEAQIILLGDIQNSDPAHVWSMRTLCLEESQIHAFIDFSRDPEFYLPVLRSAILARDGAGKMKEIKTLSGRLNALISQNLVELQRLKNLHQKLVPLRSEKLKGMNVTSKFAAGESSGGEFFDTVSNDKELLVLLASSKSYIASSAILGHFEDLRRHSQFSNDHILNFITNLSRELKNLAVENTELFILNINLKNFSAEGYNFGHCTVWNRDGVLNKVNDLAIDPLFVEKAHIEFRLERGEKYLLRSPGLAQNLASTDLKNEDQWNQYLKSLANKKPQELMTELFYQLKKDQLTDFLKTDASAILFEVDQNAILQV